MEAFRDSSSDELVFDDGLKEMLAEIESTVLTQGNRNQIITIEGKIIDFNPRNYAAEFMETYDGITDATDKFNYGVDFAAHVFKRWGIQKDVFIKVQREFMHEGELIPYTRVFSGKVMSVVIEQRLTNWDEYYHGDAKLADSATTFEPYFLVSTLDEELAMVPFSDIFEIRETDTLLPKV